MIQKFHIITNCSKSKKLPASDLLQAKNLTHGSLETVTTEWVKRTEGHKDKPKKATKVPVKLNIRLKRIKFNRKISPLQAIYLLG